MSRHLILNTPKYFKPYVNDCFVNALAPELVRRELNPNLILADYLSFLYDRESGYIGNSTFIKPNDIVFTPEEMLNTQARFLYLHKPRFYLVDDLSNMHDDKINIVFYIENDSDRAYSRLRELIDNDIPVIVAVDLFHMPYHRAFEKAHGLHYVVITGYDEAEGYLELFDKYKISGSDFEGRLPIEQVKSARCSENPLSDPLMGDYHRPVKNLWAEVLVGKHFKITPADIRAILLESMLRMTGKTSILGNRCGLETLDLFSEDFLLKKAEGLNDKNAFLFRTYYNEAFKAMARSRKRFNMFITENSFLFPRELREELSNLLDDSSKCWDVAANLCYKLTISRKMEIVDSIGSQLKQLKDDETMFTRKLEQILQLMDVKAD